MRIVEVDDARRIARRRLPRPVYDFVAGGAEGERTLRANEAAFAALTFRPRGLQDVARRDQRTTVLGTPVASPVLLGPAGLARLVDPEGEVAAARAAHDTVFALSTAASRSIEEVAAVARGPLWFQLYVWQDRAATRALVERAAAAGYGALCFTIDVPLSGRRLRDVRHGLTIPPRPTPGSALHFARHPLWVRRALLGDPVTFANFRGSSADGDGSTALGTFVNSQLNPSSTWADLDWLRGVWAGPLVVKGVMSAADARCAVDRGADAVVVSNHGGRQLDGLPASLAVVPEVVEAVGDRAEVLLDGGVRRGSDVAAALCLGARACLVGRPWFWGLAADGEAGVRRVLDLLREELDRTLALLGAPSVAALGPELVR